MFGYERSEIISAMRTVTDKNDINAIQSALDTVNDTLPEMKYTEATKPEIKDVGCADITKQVSKADDSGTYTGYDWDKTLVRDASYWCSKGSDADKIWVVLDVGKGGIAYVMFLKLNASYAAKSVVVSTADTVESSTWEPLTTIKTKSIEDTAIPLGNGKNKQFIKIQFYGNSTYIGVEFFQVFGKVAGSEASEQQSDGNEEAKTSAEAMREISAAIPCVDSSKVYAGYPVENMYAATSGYYCSADGTDVYLTFDCGQTKISRWHFVCFFFMISVSVDYD